MANEERRAAYGGVSVLALVFGARAWVQWTPTTRLMAAAAGLALMALASRRRTLRNTAFGLAGFELLEQAARDARAVA